jgi:hypothetical protein
MPFSNFIDMQALYMEIIMELSIAINQKIKQLWVRIISLLINHFIMELSPKINLVVIRLLAKIHFEPPLVKIDSVIIRLFAKNYHFIEENQTGMDQKVVDKAQDITIIVV